MDVHKPKPVHDWREFFSEIGIIVIGVLIALAGEQIVEAVHWNHEVRVSREAIDREYAQNAAMLDERTVLHDCSDRKLQQLSKLLKDVRTAKVLPEIPTIGALPIRPLLRAAWTTAVTSNVVDRMGVKERETLADLDSVFSDFNTDIKREDSLWAVVGTIGNRPGPINDYELEEIILATAKLEALSDYNAAVERYGISRVKSLNIIPEYSPVVPDDEADHASRAMMVHLLTNANICKPLLNSPATGS